MQEVTVKLPETLAGLSETEREQLIRAGLHEAARARIRRLEIEIAESQQEVARFEQRYGMSLARFEAEGLPRVDTLKAHSDYNDWFFWQNVLEEKKKLLEDLTALDLT